MSDAQLSHTHGERRDNEPKICGLNTRLIIALVSVLGLAGVGEREIRGTKTRADNERGQSEQKK